MSPPSLEQWVRVLATYAGRDKVIRIAYCLVILHAERHGVKFPERAQLWRALAKQLSNCRLVLRQLNHPQMILASKALAKDLSAGAPKGKDDATDFSLTSSVTAIYTVYGVVEAIAWLADAKIFEKDSGSWFRYCLYMWVTALAVGITRSVRSLILNRDKPAKAKAEAITLLGLLSDFTTGINSLPFPGFLWAGKLSTKTTATCTLVASIVSLYKQF